MRITVRKAFGIGGTELSAFDKALHDCGINDFNIIRLSSVIPEGSTVIRSNEKVPGKMGDIAYAVMVETRSSDKGRVIGAGLGWYFFERGGVFVEHTTSSSSEEKALEALKSMINTSIKDLCKHRGEKFDESLANTEMIVKRVDAPTSCMAVAVYQNQGWKKARNRRAGI